MGGTALHCAAESYSEETVSLLLDNGADIEARDSVRCFINTYNATSAVQDFISEANNVGLFHSFHVSISCRIYFPGYLSFFCSRVQPHFAWPFKAEPKRSYLCC